MYKHLYVLHCQWWGVSIHSTLKNICGWVISSPLIVFIQIPTPDTLNVFKYDILLYLLSIYKTSRFIALFKTFVWLISVPPISRLYTHSSYTEDFQISKMIQFNICWCLSNKYLYKLLGLLVGDDVIQAVFWNKIWKK